MAPIFCLAHGLLVVSYNSTDYIVTPLVNRTQLPIVVFARPIPVCKPFSKHEQRRSWSYPTGRDSAAPNPILSAAATGNWMLLICSLEYLGDARSVSLCAVNEVCNSSRNASRSDAGQQVYVACWHEPSCDGSAANRIGAFGNIITESETTYYPPGICKLADDPVSDIYFYFVNPLLFRHTPYSLAFDCSL